MSPALPVLSALGLVAPRLASRMAEHALFVPRGRKRSPRGDAFLATGARRDLTIGGARVATWKWGSGPLVVCVHGWAGSSAQFSALVPALVARGRTVVSFDAAGHGWSSGRRSSILAMREALDAVVAEYSREVTEALDLIAHSGGAAAATLAMAGGLRVSRAVFIGPTIDPGAIVEQHALAAGLSPVLIGAVKERVVRRFGVSWEALRVLPHAAGRRQPLLVVHDRDDREVPWTEGADLVDGWPQARLLLTRGLGHRKVLYDAVVVDAVASFIAAEAAAL